MKENNMEWNFDFEKFKEDFNSGRVKVILNTIDKAKDFAKKIKSYHTVITYPIGRYGVICRLQPSQTKSDSVEVTFEELRLLYPLKQKSLYEQALELLGVKIKEEFELDLPYKGIAICRINKYGELQYKCNRNAWLSESLTLADLFLQNRKLTPIKPKSEAELILDELHKVVGKASYILERNGR